MVNEFLDQIVFWGKEGACHFLHEKLAELSVKRVLLVTGKNSYQISGAESFLHSSIENLETQRFYEFEPNPTLINTLEGVKQFKAFDPDCIIAIGGGSVLDMAKLINFFGSTCLDATSYLNERIDVQSPELLPFIAIPTTAGTGSEATHFSVLYHHKVKYSVAELCMTPSIVVLNPELTYAMSPYQTACTGMDAFAQGIESYWANKATEESKEYARAAIRIAIKSLEMAVNNPNAISRKDMQEAAYWAGRAINISKTTAAHALSYAMTSHYNYPHGHAVALLLPELTRVHAEKNILDEEFVNLFKCMDSMGVVDFLSKLNRQILLDCQTKLSLNQVEALAAEVNIERLQNNPVLLDDDIISSILTRSLM